MARPLFTDGAGVVSSCRRNSTSALGWKKTHAIISTINNSILLIVE